MVFGLLLFVGLTFALKRSSALVTQDHCLPKFWHPNFHWYFYQNTSVWIRILSDLSIHFITRELTERTYSFPSFCYCFASKWQRNGMQWRNLCVTRPDSTLVKTTELLISTEKLAFHKIFLQTYDFVWVLTLYENNLPQNLVSVFYGVLYLSNS